MSRSPLMNFGPPESSREGVALSMFQLSAVEQGSFPFRGGRFVVEPNRTSRPDTHEVRELWMVAQGRGKLSYAGTELTIRVGDFLHFEPNHTHQVHNDGDEVLVIHTVWWDSTK